MKTSRSRKVFVAFNYIFLCLLAILCVAPFVHVLAVSFSSSTAAASGQVTFLPVDFSLLAYKFVMGKKEFTNAFGVSVVRCIVGSAVAMGLLILTAYPLSKDVTEFKQRTLYVWLLFLPTLFSAGLIPTYIVVKTTGLIDTIWALVLPSAVQMFNIILLINFFRAIPKELIEASFLDGAEHWATLLKVVLPLSTPALATLLLFTFVGHWNSWFDGMLYMNSPTNWPLQTYLRTLLTPSASAMTLSANPIEQILYESVNEQTSKAAQIFVGALPILAIYPFLQKYFTTGLTLGGVKG